MSGPNTAQKWLVTAFGCEKCDAQVWLLACLYSQKLLENENFN